MIRSLRNPSKTKGNRSQSKRRAKQWSLSSLERRLMLAGDCGAAISANVGDSVPATNVAVCDVATQESSAIVFIDSGVDAVDHLVAGMEQGHEFVLLESGRSGIEQITEVLAERSGVRSIHIVAHGQAGQLQLGNEVVDLAAIRANQTQVEGWSNALASGADILIYGCETGANHSGLSLIQEIAKLTGADVAASTDKTGSVSADADWDLERHVGIIEAGLAFNESVRQNYEAVLPITIRAAGTTGQEQMLLQIDGETVATYDNIGFNLSSFTYEADGITPDQVRVVFTNDQYDPANGIDRNLRVDYVSLDGVIYETESPDVYSTGSWLPEDGIVPGFRQSEILHTNGYFQYAAGVDPPTTSSVVINEIHYNPGPDGVVDGDAEFIELYNAGDSAVDLSGMSFTGFDLTFADGTTLGAGQYAIVSPSIALAESTWGVTPIAEFASGGISGGGETIQLIAADGVTVIDDVTYDDSAPWTPLPDGNGPSLELTDWALDNSLAENWGASQGSPTPGAVNSIFGTEPTGPVTISVPSEILPGQSFEIAANISDATTATLFYKVGFGEEQSIAMTNTSGDNWTATLPGAEAGELIRYRIESDVAVAPFEDTINYFGVVVSPTDISGNTLPLFQFFVDEAQFTELTTTELALTNTTIEAVVYLRRPSDRQCNGPSSRRRLLA